MITVHFTVANVGKPSEQNMKLQVPRNVKFSKKKKERERETRLFDLRIFFFSSSRMIKV